MASLATTVADLHDMGIVHGAIVPEHVLVAPDGRPVLCGFGSAGRVGDGDERQPSTDVAALGRLLRRLATGPDARGLRRVAEAATADEPDARPSARDVAAELSAAVPGARLPAPKPAAAGLGGDPARDLRSLVGGAHAGRGRRRPPQPAEPRPRSVLLGTDWDAAVVDGPADESRRPRPSRPRWMVERPALAPPPRHRGRRRTGVRSGAMLGAMVAVVAVGLIPRHRGRRRRPTPPGRPPLPWRCRPPGHRRPPPRLPLPRASPARRPGQDCPVPASVLIADVDGDGCLDALRYADGVLEAAGARWAVGQAGDQVATGDWSCRGTRTSCCSDHPPGEVFRFEGGRWAEPVRRPWWPACPGARRCGRPTSTVTAATSWWSSGGSCRPRSSDCPDRRREPARPSPAPPRVGRRHRRRPLRPGRQRAGCAVPSPAHHARAVAGMGRATRSGGGRLRHPPPGGGRRVLVPGRHHRRGRRPPPGAGRRAGGCRRPGHGGSRPPPAGRVAHPHPGGIGPTAALATSAPPPAPTTTTTIYSAAPPRPRRSPAAAGRPPPTRSPCAAYRRRGRARRLPPARRSAGPRSATATPSSPATASGPSPTTCSTSRGVVPPPTPRSSPTGCA